MDRAAGFYPADPGSSPGGDIDESGGDSYREHGHENYARLAQLVEQLVYTEKVGGSSPSPRT
jgi:hypothetical protein